MAETPEKILIIQSDPIVRDLMALALNRAGFESIATENLEQGLQALHANPPQLILLDLFLQDGVGLDLLVKTMEASSPASIPIIIVSRLGFREIVRQSIEAGASDFIIKPVDSAELIQRVQRVLSRKKAETRTPTLHPKK